MRSSDSFFPMAFLHWDVLLLKCTWWELTWFPHSWTMVTLILTLSSRMNYEELPPNKQYTCWFPIPYSCIYWSWHWPQRCTIHSCSQPWHPIYMRGTGLGCLGFITQEQTTVNRRQGDHFQQTNIINDNLYCIVCSIWFRYDMRLFILG